ncbi:MAG: S1C family serine protease [Lachnospiraceae bacterium]|nr:S1C family serine protease [Lachnospiraceae bacterium]
MSDEKEKKNIKEDSNGAVGTENEGHYAFLRETVKEKPLGFREHLTRLAALAFSAALFGLIAGLVFRSVTSDKGAGVQPVSIPRDETQSESAESGFSESPAESSDSASGELPIPAEDVTPSPEPAKNPELTEEEKNALAVDNQERFYKSMRTAAESVFKSIVTVTGSDSAEDWFRTENVNHSASGVIVADNGQSFLILVDYRPLAGSEQLSVSFSDGSICDAEITARDPATNISIVSVAKSSPGVDPEEAQPAVLGNSYTLLTGDAVIAVGSPLETSFSFACGHVTSLSKNVTYPDGEFSLITTDIPGTSNGSGMLIDRDGRIMGLISQQYSPQGTAIISAIPISHIKSVIELLSNGSPVPYLGIAGQDISGELSALTGMPQGIYVTDAAADSPAMAAGVQPADIITMLDGKPVKTLHTFRERLLDLTVGQTLMLTVLRNGAEGYVEINLETQIGELP